MAEPTTYPEVYGEIASKLDGWLKALASERNERKLTPKARIINVDTAKRINELLKFMADNDPGSIQVGMDRCLKWFFEKKLRNLPIFSPHRISEGYESVSRIRFLPVGNMSRMIHDIKFHYLPVVDLDNMRVFFLMVNDRLHRNIMKLSAELDSHYADEQHGTNWCLTINQAQFRNRIVLLPEIYPMVKEAGPLPQHCREAAMKFIAQMKEERESAERMDNYINDLRMARQKQ